MNICIRPETSEEIEAIDTLLVEAFLNAAHTDHTEQYIVKALRSSGALTISLVAELNNEVIGHVAISPVWVSDGTKNWFGLGPLSVTPEYFKALSISKQIPQGSVSYHSAFGAKG